MSYKFTYFNITARGEPGRLIFAAAGVKFIDNQIPFSDLPVLKAKHGVEFLPILEVGDKTLAQSKAIFRYLAQKFNLVGSDEWESAKCDELVDAMGELLEMYSDFGFKERDPVKKVEKKNLFVTQTLPTFLGRVNKIQMENGGSWLVGKNMTWADLVIAEYLRQLCHVSGDPLILNGHPNVKKMMDAVFSHQNIKEYRDNATHINN